jgi:putative transposase
VIGCAARRQGVRFMVARKMSVRRACWWTGVSRNWLSYVSRRGDDPMITRLKELARENPRYGCRRLRVLLRREGRRVNLKRVRRLCRKHGLLLRAKRRRKRRGIGVGVPCGVSESRVGIRLRA